MAEETEITQSDIDRELVSWVVGTIEPWEQHRKDNYEAVWKEYYKEWKNIWTSESKNRDSERSKFISPALAQAIEMAVADMEEATFNRKNWFDIDDDLSDQFKKDVGPLRDKLIEDMGLAKVPSAIIKTYLNGAIYGTGISKILVSQKTESFTTPQGQFVENTRIEVPTEPVSPWEFAIDPSARCIDEGLGCAHIPVKSKIDILKKIDAGIYNDVPLGDYADDEDLSAFGESKSSITGDRTEIIEYHGMVPSVLLTEIDDEISKDLAQDIYDFDETDMTEAIVTIANRFALLKANPNPFIYKDRSFVAYQHDTVPNRFWGRGIAEKGIHSQRALNAELRARQDGLALTIHPMMAIDATRLPRGFKPKVAPGKTLLSNGDPRQTYNPMHFGEMSSHTYTEAAGLERMLTMATGQMDSATPIGQSPRNQTMGGMSMIQGGSIKRNKRTMRNIEIDFLKPLINKTSWRYQQFDPERYPFGDYKLLPYSTMGIMAREMEQQQIANIMNVVPDGPAKGVLLQAFINNSSIPAKQDLQKAIEATFNQPPDPMAEQIKQLQLENAILTNQNLQMDTEKKKSETVENYADAENKTKQVDVNRYLAIAQTEEGELDRQAFGRQEN